MTEPYVAVKAVLDKVDDTHEDHTVPSIQDKTVERIAAADEGDALWESYQQNQRLVATEPSPTIIGSNWKYAHPDEDRPLTVHERALIQTFPTEVTFCGGRAEKRQQLANAVPVQLAESIASVLPVE